MSVWKCYRERFNWKLCIFLFCFCLPIILLPLALSPHKETKCTYVVILVALYWILEPIPLAATSLLPVVLYPLLGIASSSTITLNYMKDVQMLLFGGFCIAIAVEECRLHERIALKALLTFGTDMKWIMFSLMMTTTFLSMWISNTAATAIMVPILEALLAKLHSSAKEEDKFEILNTSPEEVSVSHHPHGEQNLNKESEDEINCSVKVVLFLSVCYSANIGGTGTVTGTAANLVFKGVFEKLFPECNEITYATWMAYNVPGMILCVLFGWFYLWMMFYKSLKAMSSTVFKNDIHTIIYKKYTDLGPVTCYEKEVIILFTVLIFLWIFRDPKIIPGWSSVIGSDKKISDSVPGIGIAFLLFLLPSNIKDLNSPRILNWKVTQSKLQWGIIFIIGGGFALAEGAETSGLSKLATKHMTSLQFLPTEILIAVACFLTAMITEFTSNASTVSIFLPIYSQLALAIGINPLFIMLPVTVVASYAFMLPAATGPNAIVFESGRMKTMQMVKVGFLMNFICCAVQLLMINTLGVALFDLKTFPIWANVTEISHDNVFKKSEQLLSNFTRV